jgi:hypothetical protein
LESGLAVSTEEEGGSGGRSCGCCCCAPGPTSSSTCLEEMGVVAVGKTRFLTEANRPGEEEELGLVVVAGAPPVGAVPTSTVSCPDKGPVGPEALLLGKSTSTRVLGDFPPLCKYCFLAKSS